MYRTIFSSVTLFCLLLIFSCAPVEIKDEETPENILPPKITGFTVPESSRIEFHFSKQLVPSASLFEITPDLGITSLESRENTLIICLSDEQSPGLEYFIKGRVKDYTGNTLSFSTKFYGFNPRVPGILINEFTTNGSTDHPDMVELFIKESGNMAGVVFYAGCGCDNDLEYLFPPFEVLSGEYMVIHTKPQGIEDEIDETGAADVSGGIDSSAEARDFWVKGGSGLSGNNGALTVFSSPGGTLLDAVIYSNRTSSSDEKYRGFGSTAMLHKADCISEKNSWIFTGELIAPEDCVNPEKSTATRSLSRNSSSTDVNSNADWHNVPTGGYTFGKINSDDVYVPQ